MQKMLLSIYKPIYKCGANLLSRLGIERFYLGKVVSNFIISHLKPDFVVVQGHKMFLDSKDSLRLSIYRAHETLEMEAIKKIEKGDVVLDVGAHIGYYTLIFAKLVGEEGKVFAFEPDPDNFALLKKNVEMNGYRNVIFVPKAVSNRTGKIRLYLSEENSGDHRIYDSHDCRQSIQIESIRLDDYFKDYDGKIDFIKMDIEGAEWAALQGMSRLLMKNKNLKIISEFWPLGLKRSGFAPEEYLKSLVQSGFELYHVNEKKKKIEAIDINEFLIMYNVEKENHTNLSCIRRVSN